MKRVPERPALAAAWRATLGVAVLVALAACSGEGAPGAAPAVDSTLVDLLVDLHLADARGEGDAAAADSLRQLVYRLHDTDSTRLQERLDRLASEPGAALDLVEAVEVRLSDERNGLGP